MMKRIMFVCLGNICRSPAAEAVFLHTAKERGIEHKYFADSSGTASYHIGSPPDARMRKAAEARGISIAHLGQQLKRTHLQQFDLILCMDQDNLSDARSLTRNPEELDKIKLFRDFDPNGKGDVPDPYYGGPDGFDKVIDIVTRCSEALLDAMEMSN
jgi:protein-tyrosine phosphatase